MALGKSWGPSTWYILHLISYNWESDMVNLYIRFIKLLGDTIPCQTCKEHFKRNISMNGNNIEYNCADKDRMINWIIRLHNMVNRSNKKRIYSREDVDKIYINNIYKKEKYITFLREYVSYNLGLGGMRKAKTMNLIVVLGSIHPIIKKRKMFMRLFTKRLPYIKWLYKYKNIL